MIPIQCPQCGRRGHVPPDKFGARLHCKGCEAVFHLDHGGRMVLGEPGTAARSQPPRVAAADIDLAQTWRDIPRSARLGVPGVCALAFGWMLFPTSSTGLAYQDQATAVGRAVLDGDRARVVGLATPGSAEAAGRWYDLVRGTTAGPTSGGTVAAALFAGNPERDATIEMSLLVATEQGTSSFTLPMTREGGRWLLDGARSLDEARKAAPITLARAKGR